MSQTPIVSPSKTQSPVIDIAVAALPYIPALVADIIGLFKKYPQMTKDQLTAFVVATSQQGDAAWNDVLAAIAEDQAAQAAAIKPAA